MRRRQFLVLSGAGAAWPLVARAQAERMPRIGILVLGNPDPAPFLKEFREGLRQLGYVEGRNIVFEFRSARGSGAQLQTLAHELVAYKVDMIVALQTPSAIAARQATAEVPIVMAPTGDPIGTGLVASLARPGGNVTGLTAATAELGGKNLELVREVLPSARRIAALLNAPDPFHKPLQQHIEKSAATLGIEAKLFPVKSTDELPAAFAAMAKSGVEAVVVQPSLPQRVSAELAIKHRLPSFSPNSSFPAAGGLMGYSAELAALYRDAASFVDKIIKGRKPADLPVQLPTKFHLIVNLKTANALGLTLPPTLLTRADQVIE